MQCYIRPNLEIWKQAVFFPIFSDQPESCLVSTGGAADVSFFSVDKDLSGVLDPADKCVHDFASSGANQPGKPEDLPLAECKTNVFHGVSVRKDRMWYRQILHSQHFFFGNGGMAAWIEVLDLAPHHRGNDGRLVIVLAPEFSSYFSIAQDGSVVGQLEDF